MLGNLYKTYLNILKGLGGIFKTKEGVGHQEIESKACEATLQDLDNYATKLGDLYRGLGVLVGLLAIVIIFCALAPIGLNMSEDNAHYVHHLEISLMLVSIICFIYVKYSDLHNLWLNARYEAEIKRYEDLKELIALANPEDLHKEIDSLLKNQITYNDNKSIDYKAIEKATSILNWCTFVFALVAAVVHIFFNFNWLILITGFLPAVGGIIHGINGFLELGELESEHERVSIKLNDYLNKINNSEPLDNGDLIDLCQDIYDLFIHGNNNWKHIAKKQALRLG